MAADSFYVILFGAILLDCLGLPVAGEVVLAGTGLAIRAGLIHPVAGLLVAVGAALVGHAAAYWAGRVAGHRFLPVAMRVTPGPVTILLSRFLVGIRVVLAPLAGLGRMRFGVFVLLDAAGACLWVAAFVFLGYAGGASLATARELLEASRGPVILGAAGVAAALLVMRRVRRARAAAQPA
jgi:membrane protein DedA with SNARE-associated domain